MHRQFFAAGTSVAAAVDMLLSTAGITKTHIIMDDVLLHTDAEFPMGSNRRAVVNELLEMANYTSLSFDETGVAVSKPYVYPARRSVDHYYSSVTDSVIKPRLVDSLDIVSIPNVFIRKAENVDTGTPFVSVFVNDNPESPISTVRRGRQKVDFKTVRDISSQEALDTLVRRIAIESTQAYRHIEFTTPIMPNHSSTDTLLLDIPELFNSVMKFSETDWSMDLKVNGDMKHSARAVVDL
jgi:hypothetical protein